MFRMNCIFKRRNDEPNGILYQNIYPRFDRAHFQKLTKQLNWIRKSR